MHRKGGIKCRGLEGQVRQQQAGREGGLEAQSWHSARVRPGEQPYSKEQGEDASAATACRRRSLRKQARLSRVKTLHDIQMCPRHGIFLFFLDSSQLAGELGFPLTLSGRETQTSQLKVFPPPPVSGFPLFWTNVSHAIALVISCFLKVPDGAWLQARPYVFWSMGPGPAGPCVTGAVRWVLDGLPES